MTNILVTAMLLTGGSAVASALCGVPTAAACFLLPIGVVLYTMFGGIKATFLSEVIDPSRRYRLTETHSRLRSHGYHFGDHLHIRLFGLRYK